MKKLTTLLFSILGSLIILVSCKGKDMASADPKAVLTEFMQRLSKKDIAGASKLATKESQSTMDMMKKGLEMAEKMKGLDKDSKKDDPTEDFKNVEIGEAKIDGETATVAFTHKTKGNSFAFPLKKEGGAWKVDFSMATLMKMGMDQAKGENGGSDYNPGDSLNMNSDEMKKGLEMADSLLKNMDPKKLEELQKAAEKLKELH